MVAVIVVGGCRADRKPEDKAGVAHGPERLAAPSGPAKADALIKQARDDRDDLTVSRIAAKYVRSDGVMDPTYGELEINLIGERPPPPPDDPNRPTGAPVPTPVEPYNPTGRDCEDSRWTGSTGWAPKQDDYMKMCLAFGLEGAPPKCTVVQIWQRALADGAPANALATISVISGMPWSFSIDDEPRNVHFSQVYDDNCAPAAEAGPP